MFNKPLDTEGNLILSGEAVCVWVCVRVCVCVCVCALSVHLLCEYPSVLHYSLVSV